MRIGSIYDDANVHNVALELNTVHDEAWKPVISITARPFPSINAHDNKCSNSVLQFGFSFFFSSLFHDYDFRNI